MNNFFTLLFCKAKHHDRTSWTGLDQKQCIFQNVWELYQKFLQREQGSLIFFMKEWTICSIERIVCNRGEPLTSKNT